MVESPLPREVVELLNAVVSQRSGLWFLERGPLETVAIRYGVHPSVVDSAREWLTTPERRMAVARALWEARKRRGARSAAPADPDPPPAAQGKTAEELIREVSSSRFGEEFLLSAPAETVAVLFGVHPFVVSKARDLLYERGFKQPLEEP